MKSQPFFELLSFTKTIAARLIPVLILLIVLGACGRKSTGSKTSLADNYQVNEVDFSYLTAKGKLFFKNESQEISSAVDIRIRKDSAIWLSLRPVLGIEAARILITTDSVYIADKLNKKNMAYNFSELSQLANFPVSFSMLQAAIIGNMPFVIKDAKAIAEGNYFRLLQKEDNLLADHFVSRQNLKLARLLLSDQETDNRMEIAYDNFGNVGDMLFPFKANTSIDYNLNGVRSATEVEIVHSKIDLPSRPVSFPFNR
jgi:hypothetical protein